MNRLIPVKQTWETPDELFTILDEILHFEIDVASTHENAKCQAHYTENETGLNQPWCSTTWINPPYENITPWAQKALNEMLKNNNTTVMLVPSNRSDQQWWIDLMPWTQILWIRGRVTFKGALNSPPFACCVLIISNKKYHLPKYIESKNKRYKLIW